MKAVDILYLSLGMMLYPLFACGSNATDNKKDIATYFANSLKGEKVEYSISKKVKKNEVNQWCDSVWACWKSANYEASEEKLGALSPLSASTASKWNMPEGSEPNTVMPYYWGTKGQADSNKGYPLFLYIHGSGPKENEWSTGLKICSRFDDAPSLYFIPQIPSEGQYYRWWQKGKQAIWERLLRQSFVSGNIDPLRVYFFGISEGGYGSQRLASFYADYLAAAGPMAGGEPLKNAPAENCANIGFSLRTGDKDFGFYRDILSRYVKEAYDSLQALHPDLYNHWVELIPGKGHHIDYNPTTPWLKQFVRNPYPKYVCWEDYPMDGRYREGFYNLAVKKRPEGLDEDGRTRYEMTVSDNTIDLKIDKVTYKTVQKDPKWGIEMKFEKSYAPATGGELTLYLCDKLVDLDKKVTVMLNGKKVFSGKLKADVKHMVNSCATFFDPCRVYPAAVEIKY